MMRLSLKTNILTFAFAPFALFALSNMMTSCSSKTKSAKDYLAIADKAYQNGNYESAKSHIDSIKILHPKSFKEIREGFDLMQDVRKAENKRNIVFIDSMLQVNITKLKELQANFDFVRDKNYQEFGNYIPKLTPISSTMDHDNLRSGVSEKGVLFLESIVSGKRLHHNKIKVSIPDGSYSETQEVTADGLNYNFTTLNKSYEIVRFFGSDENGVAEFIYTFQNQPITLTYMGKSNSSITLPKTSKTAISQSYEMSMILYELEELRYEKGKTEALLRYLEKQEANKK